LTGRPQSCKAQALLQGYIGIYLIRNMHGPSATPLTDIKSHTINELSMVLHD
jgi:hypothetical protein